MACSEGRAADRHHRLVHQIGAGRAGPVRCAEVDGGVEGLLREVEGLGARREIHRDFRMPRDEAAQARDQPARAQRGQHGQVEQPAAGRRHHLLAGARQLLQHGAHVGRIDAADVGEHDALAHAMEQRDAQLLLELADLPRHRALREVQLVRRARDAVVPRGRLEGEQVGDRREEGFFEHRHSEGE
jgi:hypothetical protein